MIHEVIISTYDSCVTCDIMIDGVTEDAYGLLFDIVYSVDALGLLPEDMQITEMQKAAEGIAYLKGWRDCSVRIIACGDGMICEHSFLIDEPKQFKTEDEP